MNTQLLHNELTSLSIPISGCDSSGNVNLLVTYNKIISIDNGDNTFGSQTLDEPSNEYLRATALIELVKAAHGESLTSDAALALQAELSEAEWLAYCECRKQPVKQARAARYSSETDNLFLKCFEEATVVEDGDYYNCKVAKTDFNGWKAAKQIIRESLPYPE